jgi:LmbE family N-acetylglucosaminyl deacetylase
MAAKGETRCVAMAAGAHPDDIEFVMAGTLLLLREAGAEIHMWNLANGCCGTSKLEPVEIARIRAGEARRSAELAGAALHPPITDDMAIFHEPKQLAKATAVIRQVKPDILLVPSPQDYMEDHQNACRVVVTAAFARGMRNYPTDPPVEPWMGPTVIYHALPHTLCDGLRRRLQAGLYVDVTTTHALKREMLAQHASQKEWLDETQGLDAYLITCDEIDREVGRMSGRYAMAEGWRRHDHTGFGPKGSDPLHRLLADRSHIDTEYEQGLG